MILKLAIITGASKGIGYFLSQKLVSKGYRVLNISRTKSNLKEVINYEFDLSNHDKIQVL